MSGEWRQFVMNLESLDPEQVEAALLEQGALSVSFTDAGDDPVLEPAPGETPLWAQTAVTALFAAETCLDSLPAALEASLAVGRLPPNRVERLADREWEREWLKDFGPMRFGNRLWVAPGDASVPGEAVVVRLDPGLAFGTGTHPTTALCLRWLDQLDLDDKSVFDFGCGSGILAVSALKLGAAFAEAIDIDLQAVSATRQNAARNRVGARLCAGLAPASKSRQFDVVIANILAGTLIEHAALICDATRPGGDIALSGILEGQVDEVCDAFRERMEFSPVLTDAGWALISGKRN